jgi:similar to stage IV sporulation protein
MTFNIVPYISGTVRIKITGAMPEKFINLCVMQNILLWGIVKKNDGLFTSMYLSDFFCIRPLVRISKNHVCVVGYSGFPFLARKVKRRKMMAFGAILFLILLNILVSYIWFIDIIGVKSISANQIKAIVYSNGLKPGALRDDVNIKTIENQILLTVPEVAWVGIHFTGIHAVVEIVEKTMPKLEDKAPANIIAEKDGIITEIIALAGQNAVKKGDTVKKGDVLIKGVSYEGAVTDPNNVTVVPQRIRAKGIVKARVWYESYGEAELVQEIHERTGRQNMAVILKIGQHEFVLKNVKEEPEGSFEIEVFNKKLSWWRNHDIAVESIVSTYYELNTKFVEISVEEAKEQGKVMALKVMQSLIPETAHVLSRNIEVLKSPEINLVRVKVSVETVEDIGATMNTSINDDNGVSIK